MNNNISVDKDEIYIMILLIAFIFFPYVRYLCPPVRNAASYILEIRFLLY